MLRQLMDGRDFYETIAEMGEEITFLTSDKIKQFASIAPHRNTNTTDGAYWYRGAMTFDSIAQQDYLRGEYFTRQTNPKPRNILVGVMPENTTPLFATVYAVQCNEKIDIVSQYVQVGDPNEFGEYHKSPEFIAKDVDVYMTEVLERLDDEQPGAFVNIKTTMLLPAKFTLAEKNIILKGAWVFDPETGKNIYKKVKYRIESIDMSRMDMIDGKPVGVLKCLLTKDRG